MGPCWRLVPNPDGLCDVDSDSSARKKGVLPLPSSYAEEADKCAAKEAEKAAAPTHLLGKEVSPFVPSPPDSPIEIRENSIKLLMETEFCEFSSELEDHFEIFEHIRVFNVTIVTSANAKDETLLLWSGFVIMDQPAKSINAAKINAPIAVQ
ncbi:hypothetical protein ZWY2020_003530 [Hordeum vulgare]|nr:hypothetical protein ZWY2020_003530 [Hordeum vulgare]